MINIEIRKGQICSLAALADLLLFYGFDIDEGVLFGAMGGIEYEFGVSKEDGGIPYFKSFNIESKFNILKDFAALAGGRLTEINTNCESEMINIIEQEILSNRPIIVFVDSFYLSGNPNFQRIHTGHSIIAEGIDKARGIVSIGDNYVATLAGDTFKGEIQMDEFIRAMNLSQTFSDSPYAAWRLIFDSKQLESSATAFKKHISSMLSARYKHSANSRSLKSLKDFCEYMEFVYQMEDKELREWSVLADHLITRMKIVKNSFSVYLNFLYWAEKNIRQPSYSAIIEAFTKLSEEWKVIYNLFIKYRLTQRRDVLKSIHNRLTDIIQLEELLCLKI